MSDLGNDSICDIAKHLIMLKDAAWKDGFLAMDIVVDNNMMPSLLSHTIGLIVDGTEVEIILSIIDQYIGSQNLEEEELVKAKMIKKGIEDIRVNNTSPYEMLVSMAKELTHGEILQLLHYLDQSTLERNLYGLSWYDELPEKNEEADVRLQEVLELEPDQLLELLIFIDAESIYVALKGSSLNVIRKICEKIGEYVGSILTGYLRYKEPEGVFHETICCQDKMIVVSTMLKEHALIQFPVLDGNEKEHKIIEEITLLQQVQQSSDFSDAIVRNLKMAAIYSLGNRYGYYQELYYRLGLEVMCGKGKKMGQFKEYLNSTVSNREAQNVIAAGFELLLHQTYDINAMAMMYAAMSIGDLKENIKYYKDLINKSKYHVVIIQNDLKMLRRIGQPQTVNLIEDTYTTTEILRMLAGQKHEDVIGIVYLMGDERIKNIMEEYCQDNDITQIIQNTLSNPLDAVRYQNTLDLLKYCFNLQSKL